MLQKGDIRLSKVGKIYWSLLFFTIVWSAWLERNRRIFKGIDRPMNLLLNDTKQLVWDWSLVDICARDVRVEEVIFEWDKILTG